MKEYKGILGGTFDSSCPKFSNLRNSTVFDWGYWELRGYWMKKKKQEIS
jgi:hypothetical protein